MIELPIRRGSAGKSMMMLILSKILRQYKGYIAGGYARWALSPRKDPVPPSDIDIFSPSNLYTSGIQASLIHQGWVIREKTVYATQMIHPFYHTPLHLVWMEYGDPYSVLNKFDLGICRAAIVGSTGWAFEDFEEEEKKGEISVKKVSNRSILGRIAKYQNRGYKISLEEMIKVRDGLESTGEKEERNDPLMLAQNLLPFPVPYSRRRFPQPYLVVNDIVGTTSEPTETNSISSSTIFGQVAERCRYVEASTMNESDAFLYGYPGV